MAAKKTSKNLNRRKTYYKAYLDFHGVRVRITSHLRTVIADLEHDFAYFKSEKTAQGGFRLSLHAETDLKVQWRRMVRGPRSELFFAPAGEQRIRFFARAWVSYRFAKNECDVYCDDPAIAYETVYLVLLSFVGETLDRRGLHRIHALGVNIASHGALLLGPSGTGKSTLAIRLLAAKTAKLLSDDTPLIGKAAQMAAFPQRIALRETPPVAAKFVRKFKRVEYGEKFVVGAKYFANQIADTSDVKWLMIAKRDGSETSHFEPVPRRHLAWPLVKWLVLGLETPQVWELMLRPSPRDALAKCKILGRRVRAGISLLKRCETGVFHLSSDPAEASRVFNATFGPEIQR